MTAITYKKTEEHSLVPYDSKLKAAGGSAPCVQSDSIIKRATTCLNFKDAAKLAKTFRSAVKLAELATDMPISNGVKLAIKSSKVCKYGKAVANRKKTIRFYNRFRRSHGVGKKTRALICTVKSARAMAASVISAYGFVEELSLFSPIIPAGPLRTFKTINLFLKPSSIYIAGSSLVKTTQLQSRLKAMNTSIVTASPGQKRTATTKALASLAELDPKRLQKKFGLSKKEPLTKKISILQENLRKGNSPEDIKAASELVSTLKFKATVLCACKGIRTVAKVGIIAGNLFSYFYPTAGKVVVCTSVMLSFSNWAIQKKMFPR